MKKTIALVALALLLVVGSVLGTLAYLTSTDSATNTFTVGAGLKIQLIEKQRNEAGTALEDFEPNKKLLPIVGSAQGEKDAFGLATAENYVDKIVTIKNLKEDAYVRLYYAIPTVLDNVGDASQNIVHVNDGNKFVAAGNKTDTNAINADYTSYMGKEVSVVTGVKLFSDSDVLYNIYYRDYNKVLTANEETGAAFIVGLYLDKAVNFTQAQDTEGKLTGYKGETKINFDFNAGVKIPVFAVGVQAAGFESCEAAMTEAFGSNYNPWAD